MLGTKWCEALSSDSSVRDALRVVWIEVSNLGFSDIQVRNLKTLHIEIDVGKIYMFL